MEKGASKLLPYLALATLAEPNGKTDLGRGYKEFETATESPSPAIISVGKKVAPVALAMLAACGGREAPSQTTIDYANGISIQRSEHDPNTGRVISRIQLPDANPDESIEFHLMGYMRTNPQVSLPLEKKEIGVDVLHPSNRPVTSTLIGGAFDTNKFAGEIETLGVITQRLTSEEATAYDNARFNGTNDEDALWDTGAAITQTKEVVVEPL